MMTIIFIYLRCYPAQITTDNSQVLDIDSAISVDIGFGGTLSKVSPNQGGISDVNLIIAVQVAAEEGEG